MPEANQEEKEVLLSYLVPYLNVDKQHPLLPGSKEIAHQAAFIGITEEQLFTARVHIAERIRLAVEELSKDQQILDWLQSLPFEDGDKIVAVGDSNTDDLGSWFYILKNLVEDHRKDLKLQWVNHAISYQSTTDVLRTASRSILAEEGDWYFCAVGMFDCARLDVATERTAVALAESWENLAAIEDVIAKVTDHPCTWIAPYAVEETQQDNFGFFDFHIKNEDISAFREVMSGRKGYLVESFNSLKKENLGEWHYKQDGIHLSEAGQAVLVREILQNIHLQKEG